MVTSQVDKRNIQYMIDLKIEHNLDIFRLGYLFTALWYTSLLMFLRLISYLRVGLFWRIQQRSVGPVLISLLSGVDTLATPAGILGGDSME